MAYETTTAPPPPEPPDPRAFEKPPDRRPIQLAEPPPETGEVPRSAALGIPFTREDWTLFRSLPTLGQKAGVPLSLLPALVAKELADNALDAGATCRAGLLDNRENGFWVRDDGPGIPGTDAEVAELFSIGRPLWSTKLLRLPTRGALGNGLRVVAGAVLASGGSLVVATRGRALHLAPQDDGTTRVAAVATADHPWTRIEVRLGPALAVDAAALDWVQTAIVLARGGTRYLGKTSPHWYDSDSFFELLLASGALTTRELIAKFDGCAEPKAGRIAKPFRGRRAADLSRTEADQLLTMARKLAKPVKPERLGAVGEADGLPLARASIAGTFETGGPRRGD